MRYDSYKEYGIWSLIPTSTGGNSKRVAITKPVQLTNFTKIKT